MPGLKTSLKAVILVGGPGTRLQPLTHDTPKSMVPVLNRPFIEHTFAYLKKFGIEDIILTLNYLPETIQNCFGDGSSTGLRLTYCLENSPLGTAGAVKNAEKHLDGTFVVLNGDVFTDLDIGAMLAFHRHNKAKATISLYHVQNPSAYGVIDIDKDRRIRSFIEKPPAGEDASNWINAGTYILEPEVLKLIPAGSHYMFERGLFPRLLEMGEPVYGYASDVYWLDIGTPASYLALNCDLLLSKTSSPLTGAGDGLYYGQGITIHPSARIVPPAAIGDNCRIGERVNIKGPVVIGPECRLESGAGIENAVLWSHVSIGANARLSNCIISHNTRIEKGKQVADCVVTPSELRPISRMA